MSKSTVESTFDHLNSDGFGGFEALSSEVIAFPFLRILQQLSPQLNERKPEHVEGAKAGMLFNNVSNKIYTPPLEIVVGKFERYFVEWRPDRKGFAGVHEASDVFARLQEGHLETDNRGKIIHPETKNVFADTYIYYVVLPEDLEAGVCLLSLSSTQLKEAKRWNRMLLSTFIPGTTQRAQPYFLRWHITTPFMSNDKGEWAGFKVDFAGFVNKEQLLLVSQERAALPAVRPDMRLIELASDKGEDAVTSVENF